MTHKSRPVVKPQHNQSPASISIFPPLYYLFGPFSPSLLEITQNDPQGVMFH